MVAINQQIAKTKVRDNYFEFIRGICIICVVLIHCQNGINYKDLRFYSFNCDYWLILRQFINFPVAIFVFMTAYFTNITKVKEKPLDYYISRGKRIVIPFLVWSILYSILSIVKDGFKIDVVKIIEKIIIGEASTPFYYIVVLIQLIIITPLLIKFISNKYLNIMAYLITPIYLLILYVYTYKTKQALPLYATIFPAWFIFYYLGLNIKMNKSVIRKEDKVVRKDLTKSLLLIVAALIFSIVESYILLNTGASIGFASSQIKISSFLYSLSIINFILVLKRYGVNTKKSLVTIIGNYSYGIFFVHCFWLLIVSHGMEHILYIHNILPVYELVELPTTVALSILSIIITKKILGKEFANKFLGF